MPVCAVTVGLALQAAVFGHASKDSLLATQAVRELVRYHVMRGTESLGGRSIGTTCIQGWFSVPGRRRLARGALVLLGNGERLYDLGHGVRRLRRSGDIRRSVPADPDDRARFVLAACPDYIGEDFAADLVRGRAVETLAREADGVEAAAIVAGTRRRRLTLDVAPVTHAPIALSLEAGRLTGWSDLVPGGGAAAIRRVRRAFDLPLDSKHAHA